ncbi:hypothetical protein H6776_01420 [Candidatus Nomurabacteria bacterium]|nr:hypothetical protein [Candidatus Nomurabacteria bacterium]
MKKFIRFVSTIVLAATAVWILLYLLLPNDVFSDKFKDFLNFPTDIKGDIALIVSWLGILFISIISFLLLHRNQEDIKK